MNAFKFNEKCLSQIPALQLLANVGYEVLSPRQALAFRGDKTATDEYRLFLISFNGG